MSGMPTAEDLAERAKSRGLVIPAEDAPAVVAGASWLHACLERLRRAGLSK